LIALRRFDSHLELCMDILQDMRVFVRVVEAGSFTAAANGMDDCTPATLIGRMAAAPSKQPLRWRDP
jgi:hypothetical protein